MENNKTFRFSDDVIARIVQILQEALIMQTDVTDLLRTLLVDVPAEGDKLELNVKYMEAVNRGYKELEQRVETMKAERRIAATISGN